MPTPTSSYDDRCSNKATFQRRHNPVRCTHSYTSSSPCWRSFCDCIMVRLRKASVCFRFNTSTIRIRNVVLLKTRRKEKKEKLRKQNNTKRRWSVSNSNFEIKLVMRFFKMPIIFKWCHQPYLQLVFWVS